MTEEHVPTGSSGMTLLIKMTESNEHIELVNLN